MINTVLIDDEEIALQQLRYLLGQYPEIDVRAAFADPVTALEKARLYQPDLIFLDIKMPEISGLAVAEELNRILPDACIVFVTAYDEYALKAFEYNAVDYILKPVSAKRIDKTVTRVLANFGSRPKAALAAKLSKIRKQYGKGFNKIIAVEDAGKISLLSPADVVMFTPRGHGAVIHTKTKTYYTKQSMNYWEERLAELNFFRCHKSYLVNFDHIEKILPMFNNTYLLKIAGYPAEIPVSRSRAKELSRLLGL
jgi:DNA-binding LytR/AlgR family response regulator